MFQRPLHRTFAHRSSTGFTLIELMAVLAILGILAAVAIGAYSKNVRAARRTEVVADLANLALKQEAALSVRGHYVSTTATEDEAYPVNPSELKDEEMGAVRWSIDDDGYTKDSVGAGTAYFRQGGTEHGFDALNYMPENGGSWCVYGTISGDGTNGEFGDEPPGDALANEIFPDDNPDTDRFIARDWFYAFAKCDFDRDGVLWDFTIAHFTSKVSAGDTNIGE